MRPALRLRWGKSLRSASDTRQLATTHPLAPTKALEDRDSIPSCQWINRSGHRREQRAPGSPFPRAGDGGLHAPFTARRRHSTSAACERATPESSNHRFPGRTRSTILPGRWPSDRRSWVLAASARGKVAAVGTWRADSSAVRLRFVHFFCEPGLGVAGKDGRSPAGGGARGRHRWGRRWAPRGCPEMATRWRWVLTCGAIVRTVVA